MRASRRLLAGVVGTSAGIALLAAPVLPAGADDGGGAPDQVGWWSRRPGASEQPAGGFEVAGSSAGHLSVAALRFRVPDSVLSGTLTLEEGGGFVSPTASLDVCTTTAPWQPANPGAFGDAPEADCSRAVSLTRDDAGTWGAEVGSLLDGGSVSLVIVPGAAPGGGSPVNPAFQVVVDHAHLAVVAAPSTAPPVASGGDFDFGGGGDDGFTAPAPAAGGGGGDFSFDAGVTGGFDLPAPPAWAPGGGDVAQATEPPADGTTETEPFGGQELATGTVPGGGGADQPWGRLVFLLPLSAAVGVGAVKGRQLLVERGVLNEQL